jgi:hypothetical protein
MYIRLISTLTRVQILSVLLLALANQPVLSASADQIRQNTKGNKPAQKPVDLMTAYQKIQAPQGFPDLPVFPGTTFLGGHYMPEQNGIAMCQMRYFAKEAPKSVIEFYNGALSSNGWRILNSSNSHIVARHTSGHMCSVSVSESKLPKTKSQFVVVFRQVNRQH